MTATLSARAGRARLLTLSEKAHEYAQCWYAGYRLHMFADGTRADQCFRMSAHFSRRAMALAMAFGQQVDFPR
jgi:hypothetical protein